MSFKRALLLSLLHIVIISNGEGTDTERKPPYRLCVLMDYETGEKGLKYCFQMQHGKSGRVECVYGSDRLDCLQKIANNEADFGVFEAEDLLLAGSSFKNHDLVITNEMRLFPNQSYEYDMVVLISSDIDIHSLFDLRGKRLCHPGFDEGGYHWSEAFSQYFEERVVPQYCDPKLGITENKIKSLTSFFDSSCKPGASSPDEDQDIYIKKKYHKLCDNCHNPESCSRFDLYWGRRGPLYCMTDCRGDVAWVRLQDMLSWFKDTSHPCHDVKFLCPDATTTPINDTDPCVWLSRPWPVIVSAKSVENKIADIIRYIDESKRTYQDKTWENALRMLLGSSFQPIHQVNPTEGIMQYLQKVPNLLDAHNITKCPGNEDDRRIMICVKSEDELEKCHMLSIVALTFDINPQFGCMLSMDCIKEVTDNVADVVIVNTEGIARVKRTNKLKTILHQTSDDYAYMRYVSAVVRADSDIRSLKDLKGKKACFINADGFGWNSAIFSLKNSSLLPKNTCPNDIALLKFFKDVCVIDDSKTTLVRTCFPDALPGEYRLSSTLEWNETLALRCILDGGGDVAFVDYNSVEKYISYQREDDWTSLINGSSFRRVCPHENMQERDCYLAWASFGQVMVKKNIKSSREEEITSAFLLLSMLFGGHVQNSHSEQIFQLFAPFNNKENVLFEDAATQLQIPYDFFTRGQLRRSNYETILPLIESCQIIKQNVSFEPKISSSVILILLLNVVSFFLC